VLVIGNALYNGKTLHRLHECERDAAALHTSVVLRGMASVTADGPALNANMDGMTLAFERLVNCTRSGDTVFVHFCGHTEVAADGQLLLLPVDACTCLVGDTPLHARPAPLNSLCLRPFNSSMLALRPHFTLSQHRGRTGQCTLYSTLPPAGEAIRQTGRGHFRVHLR
jgi:hypothetical protein